MTTVGRPLEIEPVILWSNTVHVASCEEDSIFLCLHSRTVSLAKCGRCQTIWAMRV
jgi:hypothetical protein